MKWTKQTGGTLRMEVQEAPLQATAVCKIERVRKRRGGRGGRERRERGEREEGERRERREGDTHSLSFSKPISCIGCSAKDQLAEHI
jgi:hypothetical protein